MKKNLLKWLPFLVFAGLAVFFWRGLSLNPRSLPSTLIGQSLPAFRLPVLGEAGQYLTPQKMSGRISLLNVWASWCAACVDEQVFLLQLAKQGMPIYGLNYKDSPQQAQAFLNKWGNPYQQIGEDRKGRTAFEFGVYGAPETFLIDQAGIIRYRHIGVLDERSWQQEFVPLIRAMEHSA